MSRFGFSLLFHKASQQACIYHNKKRIYLGKWPNHPANPPQQVEAAFRAAVAKLAIDGEIKPDQAGEALTVSMLIDQWISWAEKRYSNKQTSKDLLYSVLPLRDLFGAMPANAIGPRKVAEAQKLMAARGKSRQGILKSTGHIRQMFAWGVAQELLKPDQLMAIRAMQPVRFGAIEAPESKPLPPVPIPLVKATLPFLNEHTATMVKVQLLTGMRPGEVCALRMNDIDRSNPDCWVYRPLHKMRHLGRERTVPITRPVQKLLEPFLRADGKCLFSPQSVRCDANETYDTHSYRRAIKHGCAAARRALKKAGLTEDHANWSPNALRKAAAQHTADLASLDDARALLGHADKELTRRHYAKLDLVKATAAAKLMAVNLL